MGAPEDAKLWRAIGHRNRSALKKALNEGASANARGHMTIYGRTTTLQRAVEELDEVAVEVLLAAGTRQAPGRHKATPLIELMLSIPSVVRDGSRSTRLFKILDLLLSKRPNLEAEGGDSSVSYGNAVFHVLKLPLCPVVEQVQEQLFTAMSRQRKKFSDDFSGSVLLAAFNFRTPEMFERLVGMGLDVQSLGEYASTPAVRLIQSADEQKAQQWWPVLARHNVPVGSTSAPGIPEAVLDQARAKLQQARLEMNLASAAPASSRLRL